MYTKVFLSFEKFSMFESRFFLKLCCEVCFENSKDVLQAFDQVTKSCLPYFTQRSLLYVFNHFDNFVPPLHLVDNLVLGGKRDGRGSSLRP